MFGLLLSTAAAATLALPAGVAPQEWVAPARLAGFSLAPAGAAEVVCSVEADGWTLRVVGADGRARVERVLTTTRRSARISSGSPRACSPK